MMRRIPPARRRIAAGRDRTIRAAAIAAFLITAGACHDSPNTSQAPRPDAPDVILITVDTLRADHMGAYGYARETTPNIDAFFEEGLIIERAYSTEANTSPSVASILTGLLPQEHGVRLLYQLLPEDVPLVTSFLPDDYETAAFVSNIVLTDEAMGLARGFDHYDDYVDQKIEIGPTKLYERDARATTDAVLAWLATRDDRDRPLFLWVHYIDPHSPYTPPEPYASRFSHEGRVPPGGGFITPSVRIEGVDDVLDYVDLYDGEIAFLDAEIGRLLEGIPRHIDGESALWILNADHGESMNERTFWFSHGHNVHDEVVRVPLMLRGPGIAATGRVDALGSGVDVLPTILGFLGIDTLDSAHGRDLRDAADFGVDRQVYSEATHPLARMVGPKKKSGVGYWRAVVSGRGKWMAGLPHGGREVLERNYYDLVGDPGEATALAWPEHGATGATLDALIAADPDPGGLPEALKKGIAPGAPKVAPRATPEQLDRLRALGYVE